MEVIASLLVGAALLTFIAAFAFVVWRVSRGASRVSRSGRPVVRRSPEPPPFGSLPTLSGPVGPLGEPAPDADLSSDATSEREIYGE